MVVSRRTIAALSLGAGYLIGLVAFERSNYDLVMQERKRARDQINQHRSALWEIVKLDEDSDAAIVARRALDAHPYF